MLRTMAMDDSKTISSCIERGGVPCGLAHREDAQPRASAWAEDQSTKDGLKPWVQLPLPLIGLCVWGQIIERPGPQFLTCQIK